MEVGAVNKPPYVVPDASISAEDGLREQLTRLDQNVTEIAKAEDNDSFASGRDRALVEQNEIVRAVQASARSLEAANQTLGTIIDIKV